MVTINIDALPQDLRTGATELADEIGFRIGETGLAITATPAQTLTVQLTNGQAAIGYPFRAAFFRGLNALVQAARDGADLTLDETPQFTTTGLMVDMSRNAALSLAGLKKMIRLSAKLGLNSSLLYMEDVYEVKAYPYWGYQRGRLTQSELKAADDYADALGVELIPCIQTLGHLLNPMRWPFMNQMIDMPGILLVGEDKTYEFLATILKNAMAPFRTKKIHIGMDEAHALGRGRYQDQHGPVDQTTIMLEHVNKVIALTEKMGLEPIMWSDMWFNAAGYGYGDPKTVFPAKVKDQIPKVNLMYWDYYNNSQENYEAVFRLHQQLGVPVSFATGVWTWNGLAPNYGKTMQTMKAGMTAAKNVGLDTVYATMWGDDGGETPFTAGALGIQYFAEQIYHHEAPGAAALATAFATYQQKTAATYLLLDQFDQLSELTAGNPDATNPSKVVLYEDLLHPLFAKNLAKVDLLGHYTQLAQALDAATTTPDDGDLIAFYRALAQVLATKVAVMDQTRQAYEAGDKAAMRAVLARLPELAAQYRTLQQAHRAVWFSINSPFGWEVMDVRYGGLILSCETAAWRLTQWCDGRVDQLAEPDEPQLLLGQPTASSVGRGLYADTVTVSKLSGV
ncbi:beta-N-acetylhexosaminidase [Lacticaseibacillus mingshuiensis]|uniref:Beta-N-acetylhexosaminidase n=1 Tax=Lacticaseibacillus mingshuiensis TaxID=2799574 RepID=A0ABW4CL93_9LACO|nr:beta-N-acetylhexosaminidase [Lacticaseibacillus mingshuiensis]